MEDDFPSGLSLLVDAGPKGDLCDRLYERISITDQLDGGDILGSIRAMVIGDFDSSIFGYQNFLGEFLIVKISFKGCFLSTFNPFYCFAPNNHGRYIVLWLRFLFNRFLPLLPDFVDASP